MPAVCEPTAYKGWDHCLRLTDGKLEVIVTLDVGPRIIRFGRLGGPNLFKEFDDQLGRTSGPEWLSFGGHRLWHAPEVEGRTYEPDFEPVPFEWRDEKLTLLPKKEPGTGLRKEIDLRFDRGQVQLEHRLFNETCWDLEVAPWCLSVMAPGGIAYVPQEPFVPHGVEFAPARPLVLWKFTDMSDPRFGWGSQLLSLRQDDSIGSKQKIGAGNKTGWAAYHWKDQVFLKKFPWHDGATYPDLGCNCELFTMPGFLEIESLGPLCKLVPGASLSHPERWTIVSADGFPQKEIDQLEWLNRQLGEKLA